MGSELEHGLSRAAEMKRRFLRVPIARDYLARLPKRSRLDLARVDLARVNSMAQKPPLLATGTALRSACRVNSALFFIGRTFAAVLICQEVVNEEGV